MSETIYIAPSTDEIAEADRLINGIEGWNPTESLRAVVARMLCQLIIARNAATACAERRRWRRIDDKIVTERPYLINTRHWGVLLAHYVTGGGGWWVEHDHNRWDGPMILPEHVSHYRELDLEDLPSDDAIARSA